MTATPITWNDPSTANAKLGPFFDELGWVPYVIVRLTKRNAKSSGVIGFKYQQAYYSIDDKGCDVWFVSSREEDGFVRLEGVTGWALAE